MKNTYLVAFFLYMVIAILGGLAKVDFYWYTGSLLALSAAFLSLTAFRGSSSR